MSDLIHNLITMSALGCAAYAVCHPKPQRKPRLIPRNGEWFAIRLGRGHTALQAQENLDTPS